MPLSFVCGIVSAVFVSIGAKQTKKTAEVMDRLEDAFAEKTAGEGDGNLEEEEEEVVPAESPDSKPHNNESDVPLQTLASSSRSE